MGLNLDARAGCLFFAFLMIAGKKWNLNPANVLPEGVMSVWTVAAEYGFILLGAAIAVYAARPYYEDWMDARHKRLSMASATDKSRVQILEAERARIRDEQQRRHEQRTAEKAAEDEAKARRRRAEAAQGRATRRAAQSGGGGGGGGYNPMNPTPPAARYTPSAPGGDCGPSG